MRTFLVTVARDVLNGLDYLPPPLLHASRSEGYAPRPYLGALQQILCQKYPNEAPPLALSRTTEC
eukprot:jgi/Botrbrau1/8478/Bobra.0237s0094.1